MKNTKEALLAAVLLLVSATAVFAHGGGFNSGRAFPHIGNNEESAAFLATAIVFQAAEEAGQNAGKAARDAKKAAKDGEELPYIQYCRGLAKTLSMLTQAEQDIVWYGE